MSEPFLAEIRMMGFNFAPRGWAFCDGQILPINQNQALFSLVGTTYGGDGRTSFALPDLRGRVPIHEGRPYNGDLYPLGRKSGEETHALGVTEMPPHVHARLASSSEAVTGRAATGRPFGPARHVAYAPLSTPVTLGSTVNTGAGQPHENMTPWLAVNFCIALQGIFPPRT